MIAISQLITGRTSRKVLSPQHSSNCPPAGSSHSRRIYIILLALCVFPLSACGKITSHNVINFGFPTGVTPEAHIMRSFWTWSCIVALFVGTIGWGLTFCFIIKYRKRKNDPEFPPQVGYIVALEASYTIIPIIMVLALFAKSIVTENSVVSLKPNPPVIVDVTAFKWNWKFGYNTVDIANLSYQGLIPPHRKTLEEAEKMSPEMLEKTREADMLENQAHGNEVSFDQIKIDKIETRGGPSEIPVLVLPIDTLIEFRVASADVIHSFYIPEFIFKRDAFPFPYAEHTQFRFQVTKIERTGAFVGRCAEMCGEFHSAMNFEIRVVSKDKFTEYIRYRDTHPGARNAQALIYIGEPPQAISTHPFLTNE